MVKKYRAGKIKREHTIVRSIEPLLEQVEECPVIRAIIPGEIAHNPSAGRPSLSFQRITDQGLRLLGKGDGAVQEVWVVTPDPEAALSWLREAGVLPPEPAPVRRTPPPSGAPTGTPVRLEMDEPCAVCGNPMRSGTTVLVTGRGKKEQRMHRRCARLAQAAKR